METIRSGDAVMCCVVLYCAVLCCTALHCGVVWCCILLTLMYALVAWLVEDGSER